MEENKQPQEAETPENPSVDETEQSTDEKNWEAEAKKYKAIADRKTKKLEEVEASLKEKEVEPKKPNETNEQTGLSRDEALLIAKGYEIEEVDLAKRIADLNKVSLSEAVKDNYFQAQVQARKEKEMSEKAQLNPAKGGIYQPAKDPAEMSESEHADAYYKAAEKVSIGR